MMGAEQIKAEMVVARDKLLEIVRRGPEGEEREKRRRKEEEETCMTGNWAHVCQDTRCSEARTPR